MEDILILAVVVLISIFADVVKRQKSKKTAKASTTPHTPAQSGPSARQRRAPSPARAAAQAAPAAEPLTEPAAPVSFTPWAPVSTPAPDPVPLEPRRGNSLFLSGEEGMRVTQDIVEDAGADIPGAGEPDGHAPLFMDSDDPAEEIRRGIIWAEILTPRFKQSI